MNYIMRVVAKLVHPHALGVSFQSSPGYWYGDSGAPGKDSESSGLT